MTNVTALGSDGDRASERDQIEQRIEQIEGTMRAMRLRPASEANTRQIADLSQERGVLLWRLFQINTSQADLDHPVNVIPESPGATETKRG